MKSNYLINILLLSLVIGLYWFNNQESTDVNKLQTLTTLEQNDIQYITISRLNSSDITLEKTNSGWQISKPFQAKANTTRIKLLLSLLNTASYAQLHNSQTLQQFGLDSSSIQLTLNDQIFQFGDIESISNHRYILHNNVVHLVEDKVMPMLQANASSFIENRLLSSEESIRKISLPLRNEDNSLSNQRITIEKNNGHWQSSSSNYTTDQLTTLIDVWQHAYALQVLLIDPTAQQSTNGIIKIWFNDKPIAIELNVQKTNKALTIINTNNKLKYQFTNGMTKQLFPTNISTP
ncbi:MAG: DUF4340 domain-containing protein [Piscirickettsiaceae bacterium]|nr:DUF4340 domain-containing protein [Piscirickettsiaceae bacterium]